MSIEKFHFAVLGGGVVGLATAFEIQKRYPGKSLVIFEKEERAAVHQSGRNSGVIHSGIYYKPGSLKAKNCREGKRRLLEFADEFSVPYNISGKVIVATTKGELPRLKNIFERGLSNGVDCELIGKNKLAEIEPHANAIEAIWVREAGVIDYAVLAETFVKVLHLRGATIKFRSKIVGISLTAEGSLIKTEEQEFLADKVVNATGLFSDRVLALAEPSQRINRIVPFRGEYYTLRSDKRSLCKSLIYPVPNPDFPFLGVHFTRDIYGGVECGPNAVLALAREGYLWSQVNFSDLWDIVSYPGFWKFSLKYWKEGFDEILRSASKSYFVNSLARLIPEIRSEDLEPASSGVRAQAMVPTGILVDDFLIQRTQNCVHILNAPSPAATSCLSIGAHVSDLLEE